MSNLKDKVIKEIKKVYDPEIPVNIYELGLIYKIDISKRPKNRLDMPKPTNQALLFFISTTPAIFSVTELKV